MSYIKLRNTKKKIIALVDCNSFYVSCERLFNPILNRFPVVVLSNNDGCVISRSKEAKEIGIRMGEPYFKVKELVKKYNVPVVAISNDDTGISENPEVRFQVAKKIINRAADYGIPKSDIVVDPLVMPIGAMATAGLQVFDLVQKLREIGVNSTCGASNISFGLPNRHGINASYLSMAICSGLTSAIMNPTNENEINAIRSADFLMNHDPNGANWIRTNRVVEDGGVSVRTSRRRRQRL